LYNLIDIHDVPRKYIVSYVEAIVTLKAYNTKIQYTANDNEEEDVSGFSDCCCYSGSWQTEADNEAASDGGGCVRGYLTGSMFYLTLRHVRAWFCVNGLLDVGWSG